ncbi:MAG TPA: universal stress protein [Gemmatimonadales bacterium]|nr:universal stress protein [Gemmatimonadales bacterium]
MFTRLLVGLDGSPQSETALSQAINIGRRFRSALVLVHVVRRGVVDELLVRALGAPWREGRADPQEAVPEALAGAGAQLLDEAAESVVRAGLTVERVVRSGEVVGELLDLAGSADAVLVGRVGRMRGEDPLGPDTRELIRKAPTPTIVCGNTVSPMDRCAVAYDGEGPSAKALMLAARFAQVGGARLDVIHAATDPAKGREILAHAAMALSDFPLDFETHLEGGDIDRVVPDALRRLNSNALFAGSTRQAGQVLVPSHIEAILRATDIPVVVHHVPQEFSARLSGAHRRSSS